MHSCINLRMSQHEGTSSAASLTQVAESSVVGAAASCRDRWKEVRMSETQRKGKWDEEETAKLRQLVEEYIERRQVGLLRL